MIGCALRCNCGTSDDFWPEMIYRIARKIVLNLNSQNHETNDAMITTVFFLVSGRLNM